MNKLATLGVSMSTALIVLTGCSAGQTHYNSQQQDQKIEQVKHTATVKVPFTPPQTASSNVPVSYVQNVDSLQDRTQSAVLFLSTDKKQLLRTENGVVVWTSAKESEPITEARFVLDGENLWTVAKVGSKLKVYGAYRFGTNVTADRIQDVQGASVFMGGSNVYMQSSSKIQHFYPSTGFVATVVIPKGYKIIGNSSAGLILEQGQTISLAGDGESWSIAPQDKETLKVLGIGASLVAIGSTKDGIKTMEFYSTVDGHKVAEKEVDDFPENLNETSQINTNAEQNSFSLDQYRIDTATKTVTDMDKTINDVHNDVVYFDDGSAYDLINKRVLWNSQPAPVYRVINDDAFILNQGNLYVFNLRD